VPVLGTWRLEDPSTSSRALDWLTRVRRLADVEVLELAPLSRDETSEQLSLLMTGPPDPELVDRIYRRTRGQPLFTDQLAVQPEGSDAVPRLLADLLDRRLEGLDVTAWAVAGALGVADRPLSVGQLGEVTGLASEDLTRGLRQLDTRRLLGDPADRQEVQLRHPLLAEAVRRHLVGGETADLHRRLAQTLAGGTSPSPAEVATHWQAAGEPEHELDWRIRAAREAETRLALANAAEQWLRVVELWPPGAASAGSPPVRRWTAWAAACDALSESDQILEREFGLLEAALEWAPTLRPEEAAELFARLGGIRSFHGDPTGAALLDEAIALYEQLPPSPGYLRALIERAGALGERGIEQAAADLAVGVEVSVTIGDQVQGRRLRVMQAGNDHARGDRRGALARMTALAALELPTPDPVGDIFAAADLTDLLLMEGAGPDEVEAAGRRGLEAASTWGIVSWPESVLRCNVAEAACRAGQVTRAAALIDPETRDQVSRDRWFLHLQRVLLDTVRGDTGAADRLSGIDGLPRTMQALSVPQAAQVELWCCRPSAALDRLLAHLDRTISAGEPRPGEGVFVLTARAAADVVGGTAGPGRRRRREALIARLAETRSAADDLPSDPCCACDAAQQADTATYAAEMARLADRQTVGLWMGAAAEWDKLDRPHDAAYCRWRAAQVALATGQATRATALLRRAARQAREHVPLLEAIAAATSRRGTDPLRTGPLTDL
jgi:hypothetical protein